MSQFTPNNPYHPTSLGNDVHHQSQEMSGWTKAIFILFIIFGVSGVIGGCFGLVQTALVYTAVNLNPPVAVNTSIFDQSASVAMRGEHAGHSLLQTVAGKGLHHGPVLSLVSNQAPADPGLFVEEEFDFSENPGNEQIADLEDERREREMLQRIMSEPFPGSSIITILISLVSVLLSVAMVIGGILGLQRKLTGLNMVRTTAAVLIAFKVVEVGFGTVITLLKRNDILAMMQQQMANQRGGEQAAEMMSTAMGIGFYVGLGFSFIFGLVLMAFYLSVYVHTGRPAVRAHFN